MLLRSIMPSCHATFCSLFFKKEMELSLIGLQNAGKTSLVNVLTTGTFHEDMIPTVGFNMRKHTKGSVTIKLWDLGGQVSSPQSLVNLTEQAGPKMGPSQAVHVFSASSKSMQILQHCQICRLNAALAAMLPTFLQAIQAGDLLPFQPSSGVLLAATLSQHVGALLSWGPGHSLCGGLSRP